MRKRDRLNHASTFQKKGDIMFAIVILFYLLYLASFLYIANRFVFVFKIDLLAAGFIYSLCISLSIFSLIAFVGRRHEHDLFSLIAPLSFIVMGVWAITISFSVINEALNLVNVLVFKIKVFRYYSTLITMCVCIAVSLWSLLNAALILNVKEITIPVPGLTVSSLKIVQLSDIHINANTRPEVISGIFEKAAALDADIIVLTGDIIDTDIVQDGSYTRFGFEKLQAKYGVYAITGNHDHYTGVQIFYTLFERLGIKVLQDENIQIDGIINIAGINDISFRSEDMITIALSGSDTSLPVLFLSHRPESFDYASTLEPYRIIQLSGHTHAGQIPPVEIVRRFFMKYNLGLYRKQNAVMYVSSGTRWWGPPMRFGNTSEIAVITLVGSSDDT